MAWNKDSAKAKAWREQRDAKIKALTEEFDRRTLALRDTREWRNLLNYFRTFHDYSYKNMSLIIQQCPNLKQLGYGGETARAFKRARLAYYEDAEENEWF